MLASDELQLRAPRAVDVGDRALCLVRLDDGVYAVDDHCPHRGNSLARGTVCGSVLTCAFHTWQFDVRSGALMHLRAPDRLATFEARERNGLIEVRLPG